MYSIKHGLSQLWYIYIWVVVRSDILLQVILLCTVGSTMVFLTSLSGHRHAQYHHHSW